METHSDAAEYYHKALIFSRRNKDHNLETLSLIALIVTDICRGYTKEIICEKYKSTAIQVYDDSLEYNLYINKLLADMILSFINDSSIDNKTYQEFERIGYYSAINLCKSFELKNFVNLDLFLM